MANTLGSNNPFPSVLFAEHVDPANPGAGTQRLFVDTDHILKLIDSAGTVTTFTGAAGLTDPMTTRGDIIVRDASNVTARLAIGSSGKVLSSNGTDVSWQTPSAGAALVNGVFRSTSDITTTSTTFVDLTGFSVTLTTGARRVLCTFNVNPWNSGANRNIFTLDVDGTNVGSATDGLSNVATGASGSNISGNGFAFLTDVLSAASHTFKVRWRTVGGTAHADGTLGTTTFGVMEQPA